VTIRTKEAEVPSEFPPARLFLDDIDEVVRILVAGAENRKREGSLDEDPARTMLTLTVEDRVCDDVQDLPKVAKKTINLLVRVERQYWTQTSLGFSRSGTYLSFYGVTREERLTTFHDLEPIFRRRNLWLATFLSSQRKLFITLLNLWLFTAMVLVLIYMSNKQTPRMLTLGFWMLLLSTPIMISLFATTRHHSIIIMRHSSEPSALRQGLRDKLPAMLIGIAIGGVLTFFLTLLGYYLKHKYWP
jgi:hypothetical protein